MTVDRSEVSELWDLAHEARREADNANHAISSHEKVCAERYSAIRATLDTILTILKWGGVALVSGMGIMLWAYLRQSLNLP